jgi:hypothetical protein
MYRIVYENVENWELEDVERFIAGRLLHQHLKYPVDPTGKIKWPQFAQLCDLKRLT